ncbi:MAG: extracellular solute-binding protein, partial [Sphaerochaeta sp.]|nr:extracellular solute-binding protein [Sphaerochaeta sp.]
LRLWMGIPAENGPQDVVDAFNREYKDKGIQVEYERFVNNDQGNLKLETNLLAGSGIDVYASYGGLTRVAKRAESNMAMDLTPFLQRDNLIPEDIFGETAITLSKVNGVLYALPTTLTKTSFLINKDMFDEAGIEVPTSWTYDEFREIAKKLTKGEGLDKVYGMFWNSTQNFYEVQARLSSRTLGGDWMYAPGANETDLNNDVIVKTLELVNNTMNVDYSAPSHVDTVTQKLTMENMFLNGKVAIVADNFIIRSVKDLEQFPHDFVTAFVPQPVAEKGGDKYTWAQYGDQLSINPKSKNIDAAWEFLKWYATEGVEYMAIGGRIGLAKTLNKDAIMDRFFKGVDEIIDIESAKKYFIYNEGDNLTSTTIFKKAPEIQKVMNEECEAILTERKTAREGLNDAKKRADEFLKK